MNFPSPCPPDCQIEVENIFSVKNLDKFHDSNENKWKLVLEVIEKTQTVMSYAYLFKYIIIGDTGKRNSDEKYFPLFSIDFSDFRPSQQLSNKFSCRKQKASSLEFSLHEVSISDGSIPSLEIAWP